MRKIALALGLWAALGCSGAGEKLLELSGTEIAAGEDAVHPEDFPLPPPEEGELVTSMKMALAGTKTETVQYKLPAGTDPEAVLKRYEELLAADGHTITRADQGGAKTFTSDLGEGASVTVGAMDVDGEIVLSLIAVGKE